MKFSRSCLLAGSALVLGEAAASSTPIKFQLERRVAGVTIPGPSHKRASTGQKVDLDTWIQHNADLQWFTNISVGTPPKTFSVLLDTGSADLLLLASNCTNCGGHNLYDAAKSTSFKTLPGDTSIEAVFGTQGDTQPVTTVSNLTAHLVVDTVSLAGLSVPELPFILVNHATEGMVTMPMDGLLGLSPLNLTHFSEAGQGTTFFWSLVLSGAVPSPVFGLHLNSGDEANGGELTLGGIDENKFSGIDENKFSGDLAYVDFDMPIVSLALEWFIESPAVFVGNKKVSSATGLALLDSGTAYVMTPDNTTAAVIYAAISPNIIQIDPAGAWGAPCDILAEVNAENINFAIGPEGQAKNMTLPPGAFNLGEYPGKPGICQAVFVNTPAGAEIQDPEGKGRVAWVIGSPLMKGYYNVFDQTDTAKLKYGFAPLKESSGAAPPPKSGGSTVSVRSGGAVGLAALVGVLTVLCL